MKFSKKVQSPDQQCQHDHHLGTGQKCRFLSPTIELVIQNLWEWDSVIYISTSLPDDSDALSSLRTSVLEVSKFHCQRKQERTQSVVLMLITSALCPQHDFRGMCQVHITSKFLVLNILNPRKMFSFFLCSLNNDEIQPNVPLTKRFINLC